MKHGEGIVLHSYLNLNLKGVSALFKQLDLHGWGHVKCTDVSSFFPKNILQKHSHQF